MRDKWSVCLFVFTYFVLFPNFSNVLDNPTHSLRRFYKHYIPSVYHVIYPIDNPQSEEGVSTLFNIDQVLSPWCLPKVSSPIKIIATFLLRTSPSVFFFSKPSPRRSLVSSVPLPFSGHCTCLLNYNHRKPKPILLTFPFLTGWLFKVVKDNPKGRFQTLLRTCHLCPSDRMCIHSKDEMFSFLCT